MRLTWTEFKEKVDESLSKREIPEDVTIWRIQILAPGSISIAYDKSSNTIEIKNM